MVDRNPQTIAFDDLASVLRLSTKYDIPTFRWKCIEELKSTYPCTLEAFDAKGYDGRSNLNVSDAQLGSAMRLFRECDVPELLPSLFYLITRGSLADTLQRIHDLHEYDSLNRILLVREKLINAQVADIAPYLYRPRVSDHCSTPNKCSENGLARVRLIYGHDPIIQRALKDRNGQFCSALGYCSVCTTSFRNAYLEGRRKVWGELPGYFDLGTWEELLKPIK